MRKAKEIAGRKCPRCGEVKNQVLNGNTVAGSQRCFCKKCKKYYTLDPKTREISEELKNQAVKVYLSGVSARKVGQMFGFSKANVLVWLKKTL